MDEFEKWWGSQASGLGGLHKSVALSAWQAATRIEREACAACVPTNWCDSMLTGPNAVIGDVADCRPIGRPQRRESWRALTWGSAGVRRG